MEATESSDGLCRLCASLFCSKSGFFIFGDSHITSKIELYLQIQLVEDDFLPKNICSNCLSKIESFHEFAENARKIQHSFHIYNDTNVFEVHQDENFIHRLEVCVCWIAIVVPCACLGQQYLKKIIMLNWKIYPEVRLEVGALGT